MNYPKPSSMGGTLIRAILENFKKNEFSFPIQTPIFIACSGGVDSMVLAHIVSRYGRKIVAPNLITLLHFDHGWRAESGTLERDAVKKLAKKLKVGFMPVDLAPPVKGQVNQEEDARLKRNTIYQTLAGPNLPFRYVMTAHHLDDVIETLIWRFFRGEFLDQSEGVLFCDDPSLRPFLKVSKEQLREYARLEKVPFFEDPTNLKLDQMRGQLRLQIIPMLERVFPGLKKSLARYPEALKKAASAGGEALNPINFIVEQLVYQNTAASKLNRTQKLQIESLIKSAKVGKRVSLPGGMHLEQQKDRSFKIVLADLTKLK